MLRKAAVLVKRRPNASTEREFGSGKNMISRAKPEKTTKSPISRTSQFSGPMNPVSLSLVFLLSLIPASAQAAFTIDTAKKLKEGEEALAYSKTLAASGGTKPYFWSVASGSLPDGLVLGGGRIFGIPLRAGTAEFTIQVSDSRILGGRRTARKRFSLQIVPLTSPPRIQTFSLPNGERLSRYSENLSASGGRGELLWTALPSTLPPGILLSPRGSLTGIPLTVGSYEVQLVVTEVSGLLRTDATTLPLEIDEFSIGDEGSITARPVAATNRIPTELVIVATSRGELPGEVSIDWGDNTQEPGLVECTNPFDLTSTRSAAEWTEFVASIPATPIECRIWGAHRYELLDDLLSPAVFELTVESENFGSSSATAVVSEIGDYVVASLGDSVASGEGNPVVKNRSVPFAELAPDVVKNLARSLGNVAFWNSPEIGLCEENPEKCAANESHKLTLDGDDWLVEFPGHRSTDSGPSIAARKLQEKWPSRTVSFIQLATSGHKIQDVAGDQLDELIGFLPEGQFVDAILLSGGANNVAGGFGTIVKTCLVAADCSRDASFKNEIRTSLVRLGSGEDKSYGDFDSQLNTKLTGRVGGVYLSEYFDPTGDEKGDFPTGLGNQLCTPEVAIADEWRFLHAEVVCGLNRAVLNAANEFDYVYVGRPAEDCEDSENPNGKECRTLTSFENQRCKNGEGGIADRFRTHGYCVGDLLDPRDNGSRYVVGAEESIVKQGDVKGTLHPNKQGHLVYADLIVESILANENIETALVASVLPTARSVQVGATVTAFATIINPGNDTARRCAFSPTSHLEMFSFQATDAATNRVVGEKNEPVDIPGENGAQSFVFEIQAPLIASESTEVAIRFDCTNRRPATPMSGINTLLVSSADSPVADIITLAATASGDGTSRVTSGVGAFSIAAINIGVGEDLTVRARTEGGNEILAHSLCETNSETAMCLEPPRSELTTRIERDEVRTYSVFLDSNDTIPFDPAINRVFVEFLNSDGQIRGSTSVAVTTE